MSHGNPYQPPAAETLLPSPQASGAGGHLGAPDFVDAAKAGLVSNIFIALVALSTLLGSVLRYAMSPNTTPADILGWVTALFGIGNVIPFCIWLYHSYRNLSSLRPGPLRYSPAFAVGSVFIPFVWFYVPYAALNEIWRGSQPRDRSCFTWSPVNTWWTLRILAVIWGLGFAVWQLMHLDFAAVMAGKPMASPEGAGLALVVGLFFTPLTTLLEIHLVRGVLWRQQQCRRELAGS